MGQGKAGQWFVLINLGNGLSEFSLTKNLFSGCSPVGVGTQRFYRVTYLSRFVFWELLVGS